MRMLHRMSKTKTKRMESQARRRITFKLRLFYNLNYLTGRNRRSRRKNGAKMEREPKRNSYKRTTVIFGKSTKRYRQEYAPLVCYGTRREQRQNTLTRYFFRAKKRRADKKTLEIRVYIYRTIL